jgi:predicted TIM-barrel fold metal-dependent hydrolase
MPQNTASFTEPSAWDTLAVIQRGFGYDNFCVLSLEALYPGQNDACFALRDRTGCYVFAGLDRTREDLAGQAESLLARGARGFKMIEGKPDACKILGEPLNSGRSGEFYNRLEGLGAPLLLHAGDPPEFWSAQTAPAFAVENGWVYEGEGFPALKEIRRQVEDIAENFRNLKLVLAHFYFMAGDLDGAASFLDAHPNVSFDICPGTEMYVHFSKEPKLWREFFIDYSRRIIFGTDNYNVETPKDIFDKGEINRMIHHFLQTPDEFGVWDLRVRGIDLAPEVLERIYFKNFCDLTSGGSV